MKKIIISLIIIVLLIFIIYKTNDNNLIDYMVLGDSISLGFNSYGNITYGYNDYLKTYLNNNNLLHKYNNYFSKNNYTIKELTNDIINNKNIIYNDKTHNIKKDLRESDLVTISIGMDELVKILNNNSMLNFSNIKLDLINLSIEMDELIKNIKSLSKGKIILIGYYNPYNNYNIDYNRIFSFIEDKYISICKKYNINYLNIYDTVKKNKSYLPNKNDYHLTSKAYLKIANEIINKNNL